MNRFDRMLSIMTLLPAIAMPLIFFAFSLLVWKFSFHFTTAIGLFAVVAISLDLFRQFKIHRQMGATVAEGKGKMSCENCKADVGSEDLVCPVCGFAFEENLHCDTHPESESSTSRASRKRFVNSFQKLWHVFEHQSPFSRTICVQRTAPEVSVTFLRIVSPVW